MVRDWLKIYATNNSPQGIPQPLYAIFPRCNIPKLNHGRSEPNRKTMRNTLPITNTDTFGYDNFPSCKVEVEQYGIIEFDQIDS
jgi:hypothetical protein